MDKKTTLNDLLGRKYKSQEEAEQILITMYKENMPILDATMKEVQKYVSRIEKIITFNSVTDAIRNVSGTEFSVEQLKKEFTIIDFTLSFTIAQALREAADTIESSEEYQKLVTAKPDLVKNMKAAIKNAHFNKD